jgi:uncharacterized protein (TIGR02611 family)
MENPHVNHRDPAEARTIVNGSAQPGDKAQEEGLLANGLKQLKRLIVLVIGGTVLLTGIIMLVVPGPGLMVIPLGLGILAIEFAWARRLLRKFKQKGMDVRNSVFGR